MRIVKSIFIISLALGLAIGVTKAYFSNQATSTGNTFAAGNIDLKISDSDESNQDNVNLSWNGNDMAPGESPILSTIDLKNNGSITADHVELQAMNSCDEADMDEYLEISSLSYDNVSILNNLSDNNDNGYKDINDLAYNDALDNLKLADLNTNHSLAMSIRLHPSTPDRYQGKNCNSVFTFTLNQDAGQ